ncbi:hypothetical protein A2767_03935 [Candidatus Roizmanbacteria bacterium RIFCSPHIGHO2_01_FULL_35_10]|uniref:Uncharacterized protein n=1 Tax=Candidatus Roizmanbacteria bacterium RIFCSPLOWO2_01_FULL_35_13 TaxID=1802055 RepID=A0A1F7I9Z5_9BACT|nr:MAG: hypothetical protein A2767_03935 [Candidatus Roizmanbacteria bacterium RIFCSPHIGHO2_01_FULL_35_10]OGK40173.1 MAG: hypothetical protein A3A74_06685 [Candidatus Roizmanbacteria bacterium RIFCSPLOWO2_01_FULL_35_13]
MNNLEIAGEKLKFYEKVGGPLGWLFNSWCKRAFLDLSNKQLTSLYQSLNGDLGEMGGGELFSGVRTADYAPDIVGMLNREMIRRGILIITSESVNAAPKQLPSGRK